MAKNVSRVEYGVAKLDTAVRSDLRNGVGCGLELLQRHVQHRQVRRAGEEPQLRFAGRGAGSGRFGLS